MRQSSSRSRNVLSWERILFPNARWMCDSNIHRHVPYYRTYCDRMITSPGALCTLEVTGMSGEGRLNRPYYGPSQCYMSIRTLTQLKFGANLLQYAQPGATTRLSQYSPYKPWSKYPFCPSKTFTCSGPSYIEFGWNQDIYRIWA